MKREISNFVDNDILNYKLCGVFGLVFFNFVQNAFCPTVIAYDTCILFSICDHTAEQVR